MRMDDRAEDDEVEEQVDRDRVRQRARLREDDCLDEGERDREQVHQELYPSSHRKLTKMIEVRTFAVQNGKCRASRVKIMQMKKSSSQMPTALTPTKRRPISLGELHCGPILVRAGMDEVARGRMTSRQAGRRRASPTRASTTARRGGAGSGSRRRAAVCGGRCRGRRRRRVTAPSEEEVRPLDIGFDGDRADDAQAQRDEAEVPSQRARRCEAHCDACDERQVAPRREEAEDQHCRDRDERCAEPSEVQGGQGSGVTEAGSGPRRFGGGSGRLRARAVVVHAPSLRGGCRRARAVPRGGVRTRGGSSAREASRRERRQCTGGVGE